MTSRKQWGKIRRTNISILRWRSDDKYIYYKIEQHDSTKTKGGVQTDKYIYTKMEIRRTNIYTIRLNSMNPLKKRGNTGKQ